MLENHTFFLGPGPNDVSDIPGRNLSWYPENSLPGASSEFFLRTGGILILVCHIFSRLVCLN